MQTQGHEGKMLCKSYFSPPFCLSTRAYSKLCLCPAPEPKDSYSVIQFWILCCIQHGFSDVIPS